MHGRQGPGPTEPFHCSPTTCCMQPTLSSQPACGTFVPLAAGYVWEYSMYDTPQELELREGQVRPLSAHRRHQGSSLAGQ